MANVLVVGTGTIGKPLIGLLTKRSQELGIDQVAFHKRTPQAETTPSIRRLISRGALLVSDADSRDEFYRFGLEPQMTRQEALEWADVVIDCTPAGNAHKTGHAVDKKGRTIECEPWYPGYESTTRGFIAQGSEEGFGQPFALDINNDQVDPTEYKYVQVVSCNTHNLLVLIDLFKSLGVGVLRGRFVMIRRATDISQGDNVSAPKVDRHKELRGGRHFGTHHAYDAWRVLQTRGDDFDLFSSALQVPSQYMHVLHFTLTVERPPKIEDVIEAIRRRPLVATTEHCNTGQAFSEARDDGFYGRVLDQTVIPTKTLVVNGNEVTGYAFTPQDGNSLLSTAAAATRFIDPADWRSRITRSFGKYMFDEV